MADDTCPPADCIVADISGSCILLGLAPFPLGGLRHFPSFAGGFNASIREVDRLSCMAEATTPKHPQLAQWFVVMGVAGCGKSTLAQRLAHALQLPFIEGDEFHSAENRRKMTQGIALDDADRQGWLDRLGEELRKHAGGAVLSCSALKRAYRDRLRSAVPGLRFIHIKVTQALANARVSARSAEHFFPSSVVASQFAALEDPAGEERVLQVEGSLTPSELLARAIDWIGAQSHQADVK